MASVVKEFGITLGTGKRLRFVHIINPIDDGIRLYEDYHKPDHILRYDSRGRVFDNVDIMIGRFSLDCDES